MVLETPKQSDIVLKYLSSENSMDWPILKRYPGYDCCFLAFHPFLIVKEDGEKTIIPYRHFPSKSAIVKNYNRLSWSEFVKMSGVKDTKTLDDCLAFYHCARRFANRNEFEKLISVTEKQDSIVIEAQVDYLPEIIEDDLLRYFAKKGYTELCVYDDINDERNIFKIDSLLDDELNNIHHIRIESPDHKILIVEDFDERFTYFLGSKIDIKELIEELDLEGFYCDEYTASNCSYDIIDDNLVIDWDGKKKIHSQINLSRL